MTLLNTSFFLFIVSHLVYFCVTNYIVYTDNPWKLPTHFLNKFSVIFFIFSFVPVSKMLVREIECKRQSNVRALEGFDAKSSKNKQPFRFALLNSNTEEIL